MRRGIGDLRNVPDDESYVPGREPRREASSKANGRRAYAPRPTGNPEIVVEESEVLAPQTRFDLKDGATSVGRSSTSDAGLKSDDYASGRDAPTTPHGAPPRRARAAPPPPGAPPGPPAAAASCTWRTSGLRTAPSSTAARPWGPRPSGTGTTSASAPPPSGTRGSVAAHPP